MSPQPRPLLGLLPSSLPSLLHSVQHPEMNTPHPHQNFSSLPPVAKISTEPPAQTSLQNLDFRFWNFFQSEKFARQDFSGISLRAISSPISATGGRMGDGWGTDAKVNSTLVLPSGGRMGRITTLYSVEVIREQEVVFVAVPGGVGATLSRTRVNPYAMDFHPSHPSPKCDPPRENKIKSGGRMILRIWQKFLDLRFFAK